MTKLPLLVPLLVASAAAAAPPKGAFKIATMKDDKQSVVVDDLYKQGKARGEIVLELDGDKLTVGLWVMSKATNAEMPDQVLLSVCRAASVGKVKWTGDKAFRPTSKIEVVGWGDSYVVSTSKKGAETTKTTWNGGAECSFSLDEDDYKITGTGDKLTVATPKGSMQLVRTTPLSKVDTKAIAKAFAAAK